MKKLVSLLAVLLSLVMLAAPISAGAETLDMVALQISDPTLTVNGETMMDLSGLTVQLAGGVNEDMSLVQVFLDVLGGGNPVNSAMVQFDENGLAGLVGGMSKVYGLPMEVITALMEQAETSMSEAGSIAEGASSMADQLSNWTLPQQIAELVVGYVDTNSAPAENYTKDVALASGAVSAEFEAFSVNCNELVPQVAALLDSDALAREFLAAMDEEGMLYADSYSELLNTEGINWTLVTGSAGGDGFTADEMTLKMENGSDGINFTFSTLTEETADGSHTGIAVTMLPVSEEFSGQEVYITFDVNAGSITTIAGHLGYNFGDGDAYDMALMASITEEGLTAMLSDTTGMVNASCSFVPGSFNLTFNVDGESMTAYANWSDAGWSAGISGASMGTLDLSYAAEANDAYIFKGKLSLTMNDGYDTYAASLGIGLVPGSVDTATSYIAPELVNDLTQLSEEEAYAAEQEIMTALQNTLTTLCEYVPGLAALMGGM